VGEPTFEAMADVVPEVVASGVSAVRAFNDQMALGGVAGLRHLGLSVPEDIRVVGIDDVPMASMVAPPLTTISLPTAEVGAVALALLGEGPAERELFGELVIRHSTARVR
jgi:LacI family transcriptional regulator